MNIVVTAVGVPQLPPLDNGCFMVHTERLCFRRLEAKCTLLSVALVKWLLFLQERHAARSAVHLFLGTFGACIMKLKRHGYGLLKDNRIKLEAKARFRRLRTYCWQR